MERVLWNFLLKFRQNSHKNAGQIELYWPNSGVNLDFKGGALFGSTVCSWMVGGGELWVVLLSRPPFNFALKMKRMKIIIIIIK